MRRLRCERGTAAVELPLGVLLLLVPAALLVLSFAPWVERQSLARVTAREAARTVALADTAPLGEAAARELAGRIARNHGVAPEDVRVAFCAPPGASAEVKAQSTCAPLRRGGRVVVEVQVRLPLVTIPGLSGVGEHWWATSHVEQIDLYRSLP